MEDERRTMQNDQGIDLHEGNLGTHLGKFELQEGDLGSHLRNFDFSDGKIGAHLRDFEFQGENSGTRLENFDFQTEKRGTHLEKNDCQAEKMDTHLRKNYFPGENSGKQEEREQNAPPRVKENEAAEGPRERVKRQRVEVAGRVWIPEMWGQEDFLKDWIDCSAFDTCLVPKGIISARAALVEEGRRASSASLRVENSC